MKNKIKLAEKYLRRTVTDLANDEVMRELEHLTSDDVTVEVVRMIHANPSTGQSDREQYRGYIGLGQYLATDETSEQPLATREDLPTDAQTIINEWFEFVRPPHSSLQFRLKENVREMYEIHKSPLNLGTSDANKELFDFLYKLSGYVHLKSGRLLKSVTSNALVFKAESDVWQDVIQSMTHPDAFFCYLDKDFKAEITDDAIDSWSSYLSISKTMLRLDPSEPSDWRHPLTRYSDVASMGKFWVNYKLTPHMSSASDSDYSGFKPLAVQTVLRLVLPSGEYFVSIDDFLNKRSSTVTVDHAVNNIITCLNEMFESPILITPKYFSNDIYLSFAPEEKPSVANIDGGYVYEFLQHLIQHSRYDNGIHVGFKPSIQHIARYINLNQPLSKILSIFLVDNASDIPLYRVNTSRDLTKHQAPSFLKQLAMVSDPFHAFAVGNDSMDLATNMGARRYDYNTRELTGPNESTFNFSDVERVSDTHKLLHWNEKWFKKGINAYNPENVTFGNSDGVLVVKDSTSGSDFARDVSGRQLELVGSISDINQWLKEQEQARKFKPYPMDVKVFASKHNHIAHVKLTQKWSDENFQENGACQLDALVGVGDDTRFHIGYNPYKIVFADKVVSIDDIDLYAMAQDKVFLTAFSTGTYNKARKMTNMENRLTSSEAFRELLTSL